MPLRSTGRARSARWRQAPQAALALELARLAARRYMSLAVAAINAKSKGGCPFGAPGRVRSLSRRYSLVWTRGPMDDLSELLPFLEHERADVKLMAAEAVSQTAADPAAVAGLVAVPGMLKQLLRVSSGTDAAAAHAAAALVNICADEAARPGLLSAGAIKAAVTGATSGPAERVQHCCMLLANLTQGDEGCAELVGEGVLLHQLLRLFDEETEGGARSHLALVFTHACASAEGRAALLLNVPRGQPPTARVLCRALRSSDSERRVGAARALRNLCFEAAAVGAAAAALLEHADELVVALVLGLAVTDGGASSPWPEAELYSNAELDGFSSELRELLPRCGLEPRAAPSASAAEQPTASAEELDAAAASDAAEAAERARMERARRTSPFVEPTPEAREAMTEALLLLAAAPRAADAMHTHGIYPLLRQSHFVEHHAPTAAANGDLVRAAGLLPSEADPASGLVEQPD